jgi:hypothetical protein
VKEAFPERYFFLTSASTDFFAVSSVNPLIATSLTVGITTVPSGVTGTWNISGTADQILTLKISPGPTIYSFGSTGPSMITESVGVMICGVFAEEIEVLGSSSRSRNCENAMLVRHNSNSR